MADPGYQKAAVFPGSELELIRCFMRAEGVEDSAWLLGSGLEVEHLNGMARAISWHQFDTIYRNVFRLARRPGLGIDFGLSLNLSRWGVLSAALLCANTLGHALAIAYDYRAILRSRFSMQVETVGEEFQIHLQHKKALSFPVNEVFGYEVFLGSLKTQVSQLLGQPIRFARLELPYARPAHERAYQKVCEREPVFAASRACLGLPREWVERALPMKNRVTRMAAVNQCRDELARIEHAQSGDTVFVTAAILRQAPQGEWPSLETVAGRLSMSPRSLRRKLQAAGTGFRELLDQHRFNLAERLLLEPDLRLPEIARACGFREEAGFHKAFKRWTGQTPRSYRERRASDEDGGPEKSG